MQYTVDIDKLKNTEKLVNPVNWMMMPGNLEECLQRREKQTQCEKSLSGHYNVMSPIAIKSKKVMYQPVTLVQPLDKNFT